MLAGFDKRTINPPPGIPMEGLGVSEPSQSVHDDLFVRVLHLSQNETEVYIVSFDLLFFERQAVDRFKGAMGRAMDVKPSQIFLNTTHTHAGPRMTSWAYSGAPDEIYLDRLEGAMIASARASKEKTRPVTITAGETTTDIPVSRRKINAEGKADWAPSFDSPVDSKLPFTILTDDEGKVVSVVFSVACHPSMIYQPIISAEFPGAAVRHLNEHFQTEGSLFLQGAAGDTKPRMGASKVSHFKSCTWEEMEATGLQVAETVIAAASTVRPISPALTSELLEADWLLQPPLSREEYAALAEDENLRDQQRRWAADMLARLDQNGPLPSVAPISVHFVQIGPGLRLIGIEGEVLARLGLRIREIYDQGITFVLGYSNGTQIYMPMTEELPEEGYEVVSFWEYHWPASSAQGCEEPLLELIGEKSRTGLAPNNAFSS